MKKKSPNSVCTANLQCCGQQKHASTLLRLATLLIAFVCSLGMTMAQDSETATGEQTFDFWQQTKTNYVHKSNDGVITATFTETGLNFEKTYVKFAKNGNGTLKITANDATISKVKLYVSTSNKETPSKISGTEAAAGTTSITVSGYQMPVAWNDANTEVTFSCSSTKDLYVYGAEVTYKSTDTKLELNFVDAPAITLNTSATTTTSLSFNIKQTAATQDGTTLTTYYTTDGSNPNDADNTKRKQLNDTSEDIILTWTTDQKVTVRAFTIRTDDADATNYREGGESQQVFTNTGSTDIASVEDPTLSPDDGVTVGSSKEVTISDSQWSAANANELKVYYAVINGSEERTVEDGEWKEAESLPLTLTLNETSIVKAYAQYTPSTQTRSVTKSAIVSGTYFLLDENTTYMVPTGTKNIAVGKTVEKNGVTLTFGGIEVGTSAFKNLSKNDKTDDNVLGKKHTVSGNPMFVNVDVENELGDGNRGGEYNHYATSGKSLHENTFALPAEGSFFKFEPQANGTLTVFVEQQGAIHNVSGKLHPNVVRKRPVYFIDEAGNSIKATYAYTSSKVNRGDWEKVVATEKSSTDGMYSKEYMETLQQYYQDIIAGKNTTFTNFNSAVATADKHSAISLGTSIQPIIVLHEECNADILKNDGICDAGDTHYDGTGYMMISEGYVTYKFPVQAGKTYFLFAHRTKLALSGFSFEKDADYSAGNVTLDGSADNTSAIEALEVGKQYNVTLNNRTFRKDRWYTMVLPFSVSQTQLRSAFGDDVMVLHFNDVDGTDLNLFEHFYKMTVGGTPVLIKPSKDVTNPVFNNVTLTSKSIVDIVADGYKCTGSWDNVDFPEYSYFMDAKANRFYQYDPTKATESTVKPHAGAFRAWIIKTENPAAAPQLTMHINGISDNDDTNGIWNAVTGNEDSVSAVKGIFSISGQKINASDVNSLPKGMYIVNGKKFIVK